MRVVRSVLAAPLVALVLGAVPWGRAVAQGAPRIELGVPASGSPTTATVAVRGVLAERPFDELLRSGFPARLHVRVELWTVGRWFDDLADRAEWDVIVRYDVLDRSYEVARITRDRITPLGSYARFADARRAAELPHAPPLSAPPGRRGYLAVTVEVQTVALSDLDEVRRWLRGEAQPAVQGRRNPGTALGRGLRTLVTRLLGGEVRYLEARSPEFTT